MRSIYFEKILINVRTCLNENGDNRDVRLKVQSCTLSFSRLKYSRLLISNVY